MCVYTVGKDCSLVFRQMYGTCKCVCVCGVCVGGEGVCCGGGGGCLPKLERYVCYLALFQSSFLPEQLGSLGITVSKLSA